MTGAARLGRALGPGVALWVVVPMLLWRASPGTPSWLIVALAAVGPAAQLGCRLLSNRWWFSGPRSPVALVVAALAIAGSLAAALTGIAVAGSDVADTGRSADVLLLAAAWATSTIALVGAFFGRVEFRGWQLHHAAVRERTRPHASAPIGPDRSAIIDLVDDLATGPDEPAAIDLPSLARRLRLASDDRFRRLVPWATARPLMVAAVEHAEDLGSAAVRLDPGEGGDETPVVIGPIVDLVHELGASTAVAMITVVADVDQASGSIAITVACTLAPDRSHEVRVSPGTARALDLLGVVVGRPAPDEVAVTASFGSKPERDGDPDVAAVLSESAELLAESPFSGGARRVYRRGESVVKVQRHDRLDPKPTLLEDEFHLLRRLRGRTSRFPAPIGYGIEPAFSWIAYDYVEGRTLDDWLAEQGDQAPTRLLSFGVDLHEMLEELSSCRVAHRDINPGNLIIQDTGGLVLIDFDQAAWGPDYVGADRTGVDAGLAKNDLVEFLERTGLTRAANELLAALGEAWPDSGVPFSLGVLGLRFGDGWPIEPLLSAARTKLGPLDGYRVLDLQRVAPVAGLLLASAGADVTAVVDEPERWSRLAALLAPRFRMVDAEEEPTTPFDLAVLLGHRRLGDHPTASARTWLTEWTGEPDEQPGPPPWFTTTLLTQVGPAGS